MNVSRLTGNQWFPVVIVMYLIGLFSCKKGDSPEMVSLMTANDSLVKINSSMMDVVWKEIPVLPQGWKIIDDNKIGREIFGPAGIITPSFTYDKTGKEFIVPVKNKELEFKLKYLLQAETDFRINFYGMADLILANNQNFRSGTIQLNAQKLMPPFDPGRYTAIWQTVYLNAEFIPAETEGGSETILIKKLVINDNLVLEEEKLTTSIISEWQGDLKFIPGNGRFALSGLEISKSSNQDIPNSSKLLSMPKTDFAYYEFSEPVVKLPDFKKLKPIKTGSTTMFQNPELQQQDTDFGLVFKGTLVNPVDQEINFILATDDGSRLLIDEKLIVDHDGTHGPEEKSGTIQLSKGEHAFELQYFQGGGGAAVKVFYQLEGDTEKHPLNSIPVSKFRFTRDKKFAVQVINEPVIQRGFVAYPEFKGKNTSYKFTHAMAVGDPSGINFHYDLSSGSLIQVWKGEFIDTQNMWRNRGEEQTMVPLGSVLNPGSPVNWMILENEKEAWTDTIVANRPYRFRHYDLNAANLPVFHYSYLDSEIRDEILPGKSGNLERKISISGPEENLYLLLARGKKIEMLESDLFLIDEPGYQLKIIKKDGMNLVIRNGNQYQELLVKADWLAWSADLTYEILF
jgi:hypothetical protein